MMAPRDIDRGEGWDRNLRRIIAPTVTTECHDKAVCHVLRWVVPSGQDIAAAGELMDALGLDLAAALDRCAQAKHQS